MHILFIANCESLYGANRSMIDLAIELQKLGQKIFFFFPWQGTGKNRYRLKKEFEKNGFSYACLNYCPSVHAGEKSRITNGVLHNEINQRCLGKMKEYVLRWQIDIIHTNSLTHTVGALLSRQMNKPHVWHIREALQSDYNLNYDSRLYYRYHLRRADQIICISNFIRKVHKNILSGTKTVTLYNGFNVENYLLDGAYQKNVNNYTMIICGVIRKEKGQLEAVKAMEYLINRYNVRNVRLQIVGEGFGAYTEQIQRFIKQHNLDSYIDILPFHKDLRELRKNADIALVCSENEAFGRVTIESMLSENLVIGADAGGTAEIIEDGVVGYLYKVNSAEDLSEKIYYVITHWNEQEEIIKSAKEYARTNYAVENYAKRIMSLYENLAESLKNTQLNGEPV